MRGPGADDRYWQALGDGKLEMQQCAGCGRWNWPAVWRCGECGSWEHQWHEVPMKGHIFSWTRTWHDFGSAKELPPPFISVVIELEGAGHRRLLGTLDSNDAAVHIGAQVTGRIIHVTVDNESIPALQWQMMAQASTSSNPQTEGQS